jgi:hypothetical protein
MQSTQNMRPVKRFRSAVRQTLIVSAIALVSATVVLAGFEWWLRGDSSRMGRPLTFAQADF